VAVTQEEKRKKLAELCGNQAHIKQAPLFLAWCADRSRLDRACELRGYSQVTDSVENFLVAAMDAAIAMQNSALAAESMGLGVCFIGAIRNHPAEVVELLKLPRLVFPISGMTVGWPAVEPKIRSRLPLKTVIHWESYDRSNEDEALFEYDRTMAATGIYSGRQLSAPDAEADADLYGWMEHSARRVSRPVRVGLRKDINRQGYKLE
jgi:FMN reductase (NADPH)